ASSELTGIFADPGSVALEMRQNSHLDQCFIGQFPTHLNREIFEGFQGIRTGDQGSYRLYQGIRDSKQFWMIIGALKIAVSDSFWPEHRSLSRCDCPCLRRR